MASTKRKVKSQQPPSSIVYLKNIPKPNKI